MTPQEFEEMLMRHRMPNIINGRHHCYENRNGKLTLGYSHNIEDEGISENIAKMLLQEDVTRYAKIIAEKHPFVRDLDACRYYALVGLAFNLGLNCLLSLTDFWDALENRNYLDACEELLQDQCEADLLFQLSELSQLILEGDTYCANQLM